MYLFNAVISWHSNLKKIEWLFSAINRSLEAVLTYLNSLFESNLIKCFTDTKAFILFSLKVWLLYHKVNFYLSFCHKLTTIGILSLCNDPILLVLVFLKLLRLHALYLACVFYFIFVSRSSPLIFSGPKMINCAFISPKNKYKC